jgi:uncharacterized protein involved in outer membrane biogenesis
MPKGWRRIAIWFVVGLTTIVLAAALWLFNADLGSFRPQIERLVSESTGRALTIGSLNIDIGGETTIVAEQIYFENAAWASEAKMLSVERLEVRIGLWKLLQRTILIHSIDLDGARVHLARSDSEGPNWVFGTDDAQRVDPERESDDGFDILVGDVAIDDQVVVFESPERTGPIVLRLDSLRQQRRADDVLELAASGNLGERAFSVDGELGTWASLLDGGRIDFTLDGTVAAISLHGEGYIDSLADPRRPSVSFSMIGPDINDLFEMAGIDATGDGDINLTGYVESPDTGPVALDVEGNLGRLEIDAEGSMADLRNLSNVDVEILASGPDLSRILRLVGIGNVRAAPFMIDLDLERRGPQLTVERGRLVFAEAEFTATASVPNFPDMDDANVVLQVQGPDLARFREILSLPGAASGAFSINADITTDDSGVEIAYMRVETSLGLLEARGTLGEEPRLVGTALSFDLRSPSLANLAGSYGLPRLPDEPVTISGSAALEAEGIRTKGPLVLEVAEITVTLDGLIRAAPGLVGSHIDYGLAGPDLGALIGAFADSTYVPAQTYRFNGVLDIREDGFEFSEVLGRLGTSDVAASGLLRPVEGLVGSRFELAVDGPEIGEILPDTIALDVRPGPYDLSGTLEFTDETIELEDIRLERPLSEVELDLQIGTAERFFRFTVDADGRDVRSVFSRIEGIEADEAPFALDTRGEIRGRRLTLDDLDIVIGDAVVDASGSLDLAENARSTQFRFAASVPSLASLGSYHDYRMRPQALTVNATVVGGGGVLTVDELTAKLDESDIVGSVRYEIGDVPRLDVNIESDSLLLLSPLEEQEQTYDPEPEFDDGRVIPDTPVPFSALSSLNAAVTISIDDLIHNDRHFRDVELELSLEDGELNLSRLGFDAPSGRLDARVRLTPDGNAGRLDIEVGAKDLALGLSESNADLSMTGDLQANLTATGGNLRELAATLDGVFFVYTRGGRGENNRFLQAIWGDMLQEIIGVINPFYTAESSTTFECIIIPLQIESGVVASAPDAMMLTQRIRIVSSAEINLETEELDLNFRTTPRRGVIISAGEILNPFVKVVGTMAAPRLAMDEQGALISGGAAVATGGLSILARAAWDRLNRSSDPCGDVATEALEALGGRFATFPAE